MQTAKRFASLFNKYSFLEVATAVEAVCAHLALGQTYGLNKRLQRIEFQRSKTKSLTDNLYHALVLRRTSSSILIKVLVLISLQFFDNATGDEFKIAL